MAEPSFTIHSPLLPVPPAFPHFPPHLQLFLASDPALAHLYPPKSAIPCDLSSTQCLPTDPVARPGPSTAAPFPPPCLLYSLSITITPLVLPHQCCCCHEWLSQHMADCWRYGTCAHLCSPWQHIALLHVNAGPPYDYHCVLKRTNKVLQLLFHAESRDQSSCCACPGVVPVLMKALGLGWEVSDSAHQLLVLMLDFDPSMSANLARMQGPLHVSKVLDLRPVSHDIKSSGRAAALHPACTALHCAAQHSTAQHSTARHGTARHGTARHGTCVE